MSRFIVAIDQGTTSTRAIAFDEAFQPHATAQRELAQIYPRPGWVEHDPEEIWSATLEVCRAVIAEIGGPQAVSCIGISNQRETTILWDRKTGAPVHNAIVWQDRRTADVCTQLRETGTEADVQKLTGLVLDPYFSATKIAHILDTKPELRARAENGELLFGTVECFLLWRLTDGRVHASDATNASRTQLLDIESGAWSDELCALFRVPAALLPEVKSCDAMFGETDPSLFGARIPISGMAGDQQAALIGQACLKRGMAKATYGTGCFLVMNMGESVPQSRHRLLATIGYQTKHARAFALEGSIFSAGATMQWLRDGLHAIKSSAESEAMAGGLSDNGGVYLVPAFAGLGAPHWNAEARGAIFGLTRDSTAAHVVRAGLEAVAYQTRDLLDALAADGAPKIERLLVDGGLTANAWAMQFLADVTETEIVCPKVSEATALGAAKLAAMGAGLLPSLEDAPQASVSASWSPRMPTQQRADLLDGWRVALDRVL
jgi:glycerol kinase